MPRRIRITSAADAASYLQRLLRRFLDFSASLFCQSPPARVGSSVVSRSGEHRGVVVYRYVLYSPTGPMLRQKSDRPGGQTPLKDWSAQILPQSPGRFDSSRTRHMQEPLSMRLLTGDGPGLVVFFYGGETGGFQAFTLIASRLWATTDSGSKTRLSTRLRPLRLA